MIRVETGEVTITIGGVPVVPRSIAYGLVTKPAPDLVRVSGQYDVECVLIARPRVVIHDPLSDRVESIVEAFGASDVAGPRTVSPCASAEEADAPTGLVGA